MGSILLLFTYLWISEFKWLFYFLFSEGAVVEAKAQLTGIHERVRSDVEGTMPKTSTGQRSVSSATAQGGKSSEDAAGDLMRYFLLCA